MKMEVVVDLASILNSYIIIDNMAKSKTVHDNNYTHNNDLINKSSNIKIYENDDRTIDQIDENVLETILNYDDEAASYNFTEGFNKVRKISQIPINNIRKLYTGICQLCGEAIYSDFNIDITEVHHIEYFSVSLNNSISNLMVLCPNHHRLIHKSNPRYDRLNDAFVFDNGINLQLKCNKHLG